MKNAWLGVCGIASRVEVELSEGRGEDRRGEGGRREEGRGEEGRGEEGRENRREQVMADKSNERKGGGTLKGESQGPNFESRSESELESEIDVEIADSPSSQEDRRKSSMFSSVDTSFEYDLPEGIAIEGGGVGVGVGVGVGGGRGRGLDRGSQRLGFGSVPNTVPSLQPSPLRPLLHPQLNQQLNPQLHTPGVRSSLTPNAISNESATATAKRSIVESQGLATIDRYAPRPVDPTAADGNGMSDVASNANASASANGSVSASVSASGSASGSASPSAGGSASGSGSGSPDQRSIDSSAKRRMQLQEALERAYHSPSQPSNHLSNHPANHPIKEFKESQENSPGDRSPGNRSPGNRSSEKGAVLSSASRSDSGSGDAGRRSRRLSGEQLRGAALEPLRSLQRERKACAVQERGSVGIHNIAATCYMASSLQLIAAMGCLRNFLVGDADAETADAVSATVSPSSSTSRVGASPPPTSLAVAGDAGDAASAGPGGADPAAGKEGDGGPFPPSATIPPSSSITMAPSTSVARIPDSNLKKTNSVLASEALLKFLRDWQRGRRLPPRMGNAINLTSFFSVMAKTGPYKYPQEQEDAQEFLSWLIDQLHETYDCEDPALKGFDTERLKGERFGDWVRRVIPKILPRPEQQPINASLTGLFVNKSECLNCGRFAQSFEPFSLLSVALPQPHLQPCRVIFIPKKYRSHRTHWLSSFPNNLPSTHWLQVPVVTNGTALRERMAQVFAIDPFHCQLAFWEPRPNLFLINRTTDLQTAFLQAENGLKVQALETARLKGPKAATKAIDDKLSSLREKLMAENDVSLDLTHMYSIDAPPLLLVQETDFPIVYFETMLSNKTLLKRKSFIPVPYTYKQSHTHTENGGFFDPCELKDGTTMYDVASSRMPSLRTLLEHEDTIEIRVPVLSSCVPISARLCLPPAAAAVTTATDNPEHTVRVNGRKSERWEILGGKLEGSEYQEFYDEFIRAEVPQYASMNWSLGMLFNCQGFERHTEILHAYIEDLHRRKLDYCRGLITPPVNTAENDPQAMSDGEQSPAADQPQSESGSGLGTNFGLYRKMGQVSFARNEEKVIRTVHFKKQSFLALPPSIAITETLPHGVPELAAFPRWATIPQFRQWLADLLACPSPYTTSNPSHTHGDTHSDTHSESHSESHRESLGGQPSYGGLLTSAGPLDRLTPGSAGLAIARDLRARPQKRESSARESAVSENGSSETPSEDETENDPQKLADWGRMSIWGAEIRAHEFALASRARKPEAAPSPGLTHTHTPAHPRVDPHSVAVWEARAALTVPSFSYCYRCPIDAGCQGCGLFEAASTDTASADKASSDTLSAREVVWKSSDEPFFGSSLCGFLSQVGKAKQSLDYFKFHPFPQNGSGGRPVGASYAQSSAGLANLSPFYLASDEDLPEIASQIYGRWAITPNFGSYAGNLLPPCPWPTPTPPTAEPSAAASAKVESAEPSNAAGSGDDKERRWRETTAEVLPPDWCQRVYYRWFVFCQLKPNLRIPSPCLRLDLRPSPTTSAGPEHRPGGTTFDVTRLPPLSWLWMSDVKRMIQQSRPADLAPAPIEALIYWSQLNELLSGDNAWRCPEKSCAASVPEYNRRSVRSHKVYSYPSTLLLQVKRFSHDFCAITGSLSMKKNRRPIAFALENLRLYPATSGSDDNDDNNNNSSPSTCDIGPQAYDCIGALCHEGDVHGGHYIARTRLGRGHDSGWREYDDEIVTDIGAKVLHSSRLQSSSYVLAYQRRSAIE